MKKFQISNFKFQKLKRITFLFVFALIAVSCQLSAVFASSGEAEGYSLFKDYLWKIIDFGILVFLLVVLLKKVDIKGYLKGRTELIEKGLKDAKEAKELAQKALAEVEERLKVKNKELEEIIASARQSGEKEKTRLIEEGNKLKEKILEQAKTNIDFELKKAKEAIKAEAVEIAMGLAEKKIKGMLTREEQTRLLEESIAKIEGKN